MSDLDRQARILELRRLVEQNEYQVDPQGVAARLVEDELAMSDSRTSEDQTASLLQLQAAAARFNG